MKKQCLALLLGAALAAPAAAGSSKFIPTFLVYYGGGPKLVAGDEQKLAKYDLIDIDRYRYNQIGANTWVAIKALNPGVQIYLYQMGPESQNYMDSLPVVSLYGLGRYDVSRGHVMGSLNGNNPGLYLLDANGQRIYSKAYSNVAQGTYWHLMDFGSSAYQQYWLTGFKGDVVDQPWVADGVFTDNCLTVSSAGGYSANPVKYPNNAAWSAAMNGFVKALAAGVHAYGQKLWCNKGETWTADGVAAWLDLDSSASPPDVLLEEGAFAVKWGNGATQFFPEERWKRQVNILGAMRNSSAAMLSHTDLLEGQSGTDNWGKPVTFGQTLWYALGSFLLGKNDALGNSYFRFVDGGGYNKILWFEEYERIDLGRALGAYRVTNVGGVNVYWREFERGYVYVNPTASDVASIALPQASRLLTRATLASLIDALPIVTAIPLNGHNAAFVLKTTETRAADTQAPTVPAGLTAIAVSGTQVNLAWSAATDNVGVTGYYVYLNDKPLATTTATSFSHTGLTAGNIYKYRVSAYDAVPNHSAWTASPVSVTTPVADTQAPTVSIGAPLNGATISGTIAISASATDNAGVAGVQFQYNGINFGAEDTSAPYAVTAYTTSVPNGTYTLTAIARDAAGNRSTSAPITVTVKN
jgi:hypothetical protein